MLSRRRRLLLHALFAVWMPLFAGLLLLLSSGGTRGVLLAAAAGASVLVGAGFAVRFFSLLSEPDRSVPSDPAQPAGGTVRHWTEKALMAWTGLCIAALTAEVVRAGLSDSDRLISAVGYLLLLALMTMQSIRLVRAEHALPPARKAP
jgi:hypothetical protein